MCFEIQEKIEKAFCIVLLFNVWPVEKAAPSLLAGQCVAAISIMLIGLEALASEAVLGPIVATACGWQSTFWGNLICTLLRFHSQECLVDTGDSVQEVCVCGGF